MKRDLIPGIVLPPEAAQSLRPHPHSGRGSVFVAHLHRKYEERRRGCMKRRDERQARLDAGRDLRASCRRPARSASRNGPWGRSRKTSRTAAWKSRGPTERKMVINALNSGASTFMADFEDSLTPTWDNVIQGQISLRQAVDRSIGFKKRRRQVLLAEREDRERSSCAPRGWHLLEEHMLVDGRPRSRRRSSTSASSSSHNAGEAGGRGLGAVLLPAEDRVPPGKARLWDHVFQRGRDTHEPSARPPSRRRC